MVSSYLELIERRYHDQLDDKGRRFIDFAVDGARRMHTLIHDLLAYSRVTTHGHPMRATDTAGVVREVLENLDWLIRRKGAIVNVAEPLPAVRADRTQLLQVFQNLIGNALKFSPDPPRVSVSARPQAGVVRFVVRDEGIGIDPAYFDKIFLVFQRLHTRSEYPGTGIGLAVCKKVIERHGGRIGVESEVGAGSTFWFTLPQATSASAQEES